MKCSQIKQVLKVTVHTCWGRNIWTGSRRTAAINIWYLTWASDGSDAVHRAQPLSSESSACWMCGTERTCVLSLDPKEELAVPKYSRWPSNVLKTVADFYHTATLKSEGVVTAYRWVWGARQGHDTRCNHFGQWLRLVLAKGQHSGHLPPLIWGRKEIKFLKRCCLVR